MTRLRNLDTPWKTPGFRCVGDIGLVGSPKTARLNPGIRKIAIAFPAEKQHAANRGHLAPLVLRHQP